MPAALDVATRFLNVAGGRLLPDEPAGFSLMPAPRKSARGRERDALILCLGLRGRDAAPPERYDALLDLAAGTFFGSPGSVTSALRQAVMAVNQKMLDDNHSLEAGGAPIQGGLIAAALRDADLYAVQVGPGLLLVARPAGHERFPNAPTRPLGLSNTVEALYFHTQVAVGDFLCVSNAPARGWSDIALLGLGNLADLAAVAGRLRETAGGDAAALIGRVVDDEAAAQMIAATAGPARQAPLAPPQPAATPMAAPTPNAPAGTAKPAVAAAALAAPESNIAPPAPAVPAAPRRGARQAVRGAGLADFFRLKPRSPETTQTPPPGHANGTLEPEAAEAAGGKAEEIPVTLEAGLAEPEVFWGSPHASAGPVAAAPARPPEPELRSAPMPLEPQLVLQTPEPQPAPGRPPARPGLLAGAGGQLRRGLRSVGRAVGVTLAEAIHGVRVALARVLPEGTLQREGVFTVPTSVQVSIAIIIPILVVGTSVWLYLDNGRNQQYAGTLGQAELEVARGRIAADPLSARPHWESALVWLAEAEALRPAQPDVAALRQEAQDKLDALDWITRLDFKPLLNASLGLEAKVTRLLLSGQDVYALDSAHNRVLRLTPNPTGGTAISGQAAAYAIDSTFQCSGKKTVRDVNVGELIDAAVVPGPTVIGGDTTVNSDVIIALDSLGALLYCAPGLDQAYASYLTAPNLGWVRPTALQLYADRLYILDPGSNEIWQYQSSGGAFTQPPARYFSAASYNLADAVGFTIAGGDVFLLRKDGRVTNCTRTAPGAGPTCTAVARFSDPRPGRGVGDKLADVALPAQLVYDQPPEPSLYLLDGQTSGLYQLSLKLSLVREFRPYFSLSAPISAVAIDPAKRFFVSAGDNIYIAARP